MELIKLEQDEIRALKALDTLEVLEQIDLGVNDSVEILECWDIERDTLKELQTTLQSLMGDTCDLVASQKGIFEMLEYGLNHYSMVIDDLLENMEEEEE